MPSSRSDPGAPDLAQILREAAQGLPETCGIVVAYSGGRDSTALLSALHGLWPQQVRAVHVHHGLHPDANAWAAHCTDFCQTRGIALQVARVAVLPNGAGPEAAAREARYAALQAALREGELLAMAHHADDQAETVLFRLLRGGGSRLGMRALRRLRGGASESWLWRPLLAVPRARLTAYCRDRGLGYVDDPGNADARSNARARLRALMPELEALVPGAGAALCRQAAHQEDIAALGAIQMGPDLAARLRDGTLAVHGLAAWSRSRRRALLRAWLRLLGAPAPGPDWLARCESELLAAAADRQPELALGAWRLRRYDDRLWLLPLLDEPPAGWETSWTTQAPLELPGDAGTLECASGPSLDIAVRLARPADSLVLHHNGAHQRLKQHFQAQRVPPWERPRMPLLSCRGEAVQLGNRRLPAASARLGETRILWRPGRRHCRPDSG